MAETYFNTQDGRLYIGEAAIAEGMEQPGNELIPLAQILKAREFSLPDEYDIRPRKKWSREECLEVGHWVLNLLSEDSSDESITDSTPLIANQYFRRLYPLRLGPGKKTITGYFGPMWAYAEELGSGSVRNSEKFNDWTREQFISYASALANELGRKPGEVDYDARFKAFMGPHSDFITYRVGSIRKLNELIGFPDIKEWEKHDYRDWGVRVMLANDEVPFSVRLFRHLSKLGRGPGDSAIRSHFVTISNFQQIVAEAAATSIQERAEQDALLMAEYDLLAKSEKLILPEDMEMEERLQATAKYLVATKCLPRLNHEAAAAIASHSSRRFVTSLRERKPELTAGFIETTAVALGVFDYIWPMDEWRQYLKVKYTDLGYKLRPSWHPYWTGQLTVKAAL